MYTHPLTCTGRHLHCYLFAYMFCYHFYSIRYIDSIIIAISKTNLVGPNSWLSFFRIYLFIYLFIYILQNNLNNVLFQNISQIIALYFSKMAAPSYYSVRLKSQTALRDNISSPLSILPPSQLDPVGVE